jgi:hypothetical protein
MKKRTFVLISLFTLLLSGCITMRVETKIKKGGSGSHTVLVAFDKSAMEALGGVSSEDVGSEEFVAQAQAQVSHIPGAKVEEYKTDELEGVKVSVPFKSFEELERISTKGGLIELFDTVAISHEGDTTTLQGSFSTLAPTDLGEGLEGFDVENMDLEEMGVEVTYSIEVEGQILSYAPKHNATVKGGKVTWDLVKANPDETALMVKWGPGGGTDMTVVLLAVVAMGGVTLAAVGGLLMIRDRNRGVA